MNWLHSFLPLQFLWVVFGSPIGTSEGIPKETETLKWSPFEVEGPVSKLQPITESRQFQPTNKRIEGVSEMLETKFNKKSIPKKIKLFKIGGKKPEKKSAIKFYEAKQQQQQQQQPEVLYSALPNSFFPSIVPLIPYIPRNLEPPTRMFEEATRFIVPPVTIEVISPSRTKYVLKQNSLD